MGAICRLQIEKFSHFSVAKMGQNAAKGAKMGAKKEWVIVAYCSCR